MLLIVPAPREPVPRLVCKRKLNCICCFAAHRMQGLLLSIKSRLRNVEMCHLKPFTPASSQDFIRLQAHFECFSFLTLSFVPCIAPKAARRRASLEEHLLNACSCRGGRQPPPLIYRVTFPSRPAALFSLENKSTGKGRVFISAGTAPKSTGGACPVSSTHAQVLDARATV